MRLPSRYWASGVNCHSAVKPISTATIMASLGRILVERGRAKEAEALLAPAQNIRQNAYLPGDRRVANTKCWLGAAYSATGRHREAEPLLLEAHRLLADTPAAFANDRRSSSPAGATMCCRWRYRVHSTTARR